MLFIAVPDLHCVEQQGSKYGERDKYDQQRQTHNEVILRAVAAGEGDSHAGAADGDITALLTMTSAGMTIASGLTPMPCAREMQIGVNIALVAVLDMN